MRPQFITATLATLLISGALQAQTFERRATMRGGNRAGSGKCTVEVIVDGAATVEIRGDMAYLRNLNGQQPQWRRFECDSVMPPNPVNFRFQGIDGRGRQTLVRDPRNGAAVIQIEDPDNGSQGYTFDITWGNGGDYPNGGYQTDRGYNDRNQQGGFGNNGRGNYGRGRFTAEQAVQVCQDSIREQARNQFRTNEITFRRTNVDDQPGRNDWVVGSIEVRGRNGGSQVARFSCSVNFDNGNVRSAQIEPFGDDRRGYNDGNGNGYGRGNMPAAAIQNCQRSVEDRLRGDGYNRPQFGTIRADDQPGRNDWVVGDVRAYGRNGQDNMRFSCSVDMRSGAIRSVDVTRR